MLLSICRWIPDEGPGTYNGNVRGGRYNSSGGPQRQDTGNYRYEANSRYDAPPAEKQNWTKPLPRNDRIEQ